MDKNLKAIIENEYRLIWGKDEKMVKYCLGRVSDAVLLSNGLIYIFEKPNLETSFCFGYDNDDASYNHANNMAKTVTDDYGEYFVKRNVDCFNRFAEIFEEKKYDKFLVHARYNKSAKFSSNIYKKSDVDYHPWMVNSNVNLFEINDEDIKQLLKINELEKEKMTKRCFTYLKKYGTEKLRVWTYWRD
jgi:hypothetical protein